MESMMQRIPIHELRRRLSELVARAETGTPLLITRHGQIVAQLLPPDAHLHIGSAYGGGALVPLLHNRTRGRYLDVVADDRGGGGAES
jgi:prevent-host-death family protein